MRSLAVGRYAGNGDCEMHDSADGRPLLFFPVQHERAAEPACAACIADCHVRSARASLQADVQADHHGAASEPVKTYFPYHEKNASCSRPFQYDLCQEAYARLTVFRDSFLKVTFPHNRSNQGS